MPKKGTPGGLSGYIDECEMLSARRKWESEKKAFVPPCRLSRVPNLPPRQ